MKTLKLLSTVAFSVALLGCGGSSDGESSNADIQGSWASPCALEDDDSSIRAEWTFNGNTLTQSRVTYLNSVDCTGNLTLSLNLPGTISVDGTTTELSDGDAKNIDIVYRSGNITASDLAVGVLESQGTTLDAVFAAQGIADINNLPFETFGRVQAELFSIYRVDGDELRIGSTSGGFDGTTPALRSDRLSTSSILTRL